MNGLEEAAVLRERRPIVAHQRVLHVGEFFMRVDGRCDGTSQALGLQRRSTDV